MSEDCRQEAGAKITLPKELQIQMLKFFWKTSVPRKKREQLEREKAQREQGQISLSSETKSDGSD